ncbi:hypothetical protein ACEWX3_07610 [Mycobacterium sp. G7A2]|uniref:hypothetical protein n=1 Tax=Mycobacterium sp. G7A2 TaxID=3317307 RepID=UPI0035A92757
MPKKGFTRDAKVIASILHNDPGGQAAVDAAAEQIAGRMNDDEAFVDEPYHTDRYVRPVRIPADTQAKYGTGTRAANG